jgi:hypothetical protein
MSLLGRAQRLSEDIREISALKKRAEHAAVVEKRANDLTFPADELKKLESTIHVIASLGPSVPLSEGGLIGTLRNRIADLSTRYATDRNAILDPFPGEDVRYVLNQPLASLPKKVEKALLAAWESWSKKNIPEIDDEVLDILAGITALRATASNVRSLKANAKEICTSLPNGADDLDRLKRLCEQMSDTWHNLTGDGIPKDVLVFLRAAGSREGAFFDTLTTEVLDWITSHGLHESLRIRMG